MKCAIYTRKLTEEGLETRLQQPGCPARVRRRVPKSQGWVALEDRYDDSGFTGGNMDRPALKRLIADIEKGRVDTVVVYKVDRLSRSLLDFVKLVEIFDR